MRPKGRPGLRIVTAPRISNLSFRGAFRRILSIRVSLATVSSVIIS